MMRRRITFLSSFAAVLLCCVVVPIVAEEKEEAANDSKIDTMRELLNAWSIRTREERSAPLAFVQEPVMKYHDPKYKVTKGAIWRLGTTGRPWAYIAVEMDHPEGTAGRATYEFLSLTEKPFRIDGPSVTWQPWEVGIEFKPLPDAPEPAATAEERLDQMQQLAIRFSAEEMLGREQIFLNLHPTPFDQYQPTDAENSDAAAFYFERGFNPEVILILETDGKTWSYGCARLSAAATTVQLDKQEVWTSPKMSVRPKEGQVRYQWTNAYTANRFYFRLPQEMRGFRAFGQPVPANQQVAPPQKAAEPAKAE